MGEKGILEIHGTATKFGGASNGTKILFEEISKKGANIFLCYNKGNVILNNSKIKKNRLSLSLSSKNPFIFILNIIRIINFIHKNNIIVAHTHHRNDTIYACIVKLFVWKLKIYYTIHGPQVVKNPSKTIYIIIHNIFLALSNLMIDEVIYISEFTKELTYHSFKGIKKHVIIYNGTPTPIVNKNNEGIRKLIKVSYDGFVVSIIGGITGYKRPDLVIKIAELLKENTNLFFVFIGDGSEKNKIRNLCIDKHLNNVKFVDVTQFIGDYINASDLIISTAIGEGFGRTLIEAMSLSKPVIAFNNGGPKEIIVNNFNGYLIQEGNIEEYAEKIKRIYNNPDLAHEFGKNGYKRYIKYFSSERYTDKYLNEFVRVL